MPSPEPQLVRYDQYIDAKIRDTRRMVKAVDLAISLVTLATGVLAFLLTFALVEHWLVPSGFSVAVRSLLFAALVSSACVFAYRRLWPLLRRAINPVYAARTIEQSSPTLKNTLVNLLLFRQRRSEVSDAVYHTLEEQAAHRLTRVHVDSAVDRGQLIHLGYVLVGVVAFAAIYKIASPKDPIVAAERVLLPWADIVPASRVRISAVEPGDKTIARGEFVDIAAEVRGIGEDDAVLLRYTTADGQAVGKAVPMSPRDGGLRFECRLPAIADNSGLVGLSQNLRYHIEAGDARSHQYGITVVAAPAIMVERVEYDYADYTGEADRTVSGSGDIRAIEGTRVTIRARANGPIAEADVDFEADGRRDLRFSHNGTDASASFVLALRDDRQTPQYSSYVLRFTNDEGRANRNPVKHSIDVLRDYDPEVNLIAPREKMVDVRLDETIMIEVDARDPDFALTEVRLRGEAIGRPNIDVPLLRKEHVGRFTGRYSFTPKAHQLRAGDVVQYWVTANDNRTPRANTAQTEPQTIRVIGPNPAQAPNQERGAPNERRQQPANAPQQDQKNQQGGGQENAQGGDGKQGGGSESASGGGERGEAGKQDATRQPGERGSNAPKNEPATNSDRGGADRSQQDQGNRDAMRNNEQTGGQSSDGKAPGEQSASDGKSQSSGDPTGSQPSAGDQSPISPEGDNDSDAFHLIRDHLQRKNELPKEPSTDNTQSGEGTSAQDQPANRNSQQSQNANSKQPEGKAQASDNRGENKQPGERREGSPSEGGREATTKESSGKGDPAGKDQRIRDAKQDAKSDAKREQTPSGDSSGKNDGSPGRHVPESAGNDGADLPDDTKDSATNRQVNRDGANKTGQSEAADEGAGEAAERGRGNDSASAGRDVPSAEKTGQSGGETPGRGSSRRDGQGNQRGGRPGESKAGEGASANDDQNKSGEGSTAPSGGNDPRRGGERGSNQPDNQPGEPKPGQDGERASTRDQRGNAARGNRGDGELPTGVDGKSDAAKRGDTKSGETKAGGANSDDNAPKQPSDKSKAPNPNPVGAPTGDGGQAGTSEPPPSQGGGNVPEADEANLKYAREQTDLVLERLSEQLSRKQVDNELLKKLGWTEEDMRKFVARWQQRKDAARNPNTAETAQKELDEALRSLGLRSTALRQSQAKDDQLRDLKQGHRGAVPVEYQELLKAYNQGVSRSRQEEGQK
jgi:hypothetical protein